MVMQTGKYKYDTHLTEDALGRPSGQRQLTDEELLIVSRVCYYCHKFAQEHEKLGIKPSRGAFERT